MGDETGPQRHQVTQPSPQRQWQSRDDKQPLLTTILLSASSKDGQEDRTRGPMGERALRPAPGRGLDLRPHLLLWLPDKIQDVRLNSREATNNFLA